MGEARQQALRVGFDRGIKLEFHGAKVSSDAGLFPFRDLDEAVQLTESGTAELFDFRTGSNIRHAMMALFRQSIYSRLAGYEDVNDAAGYLAVEFPRESRYIHGLGDRHRRRENIIWEMLDKRER